MSKGDLLMAIRSKLLAEDAENLNDTEIERCLSNCVSGRKMVRMAKELRDEGFLKL